MTPHYATGPRPLALRGLPGVSALALLVAAAGTAHAGPLDARSERTSSGLWVFGLDEDSLRSFRTPRRAWWGGQLDGPVESHWAVPLSGTWSQASNWSSSPFAPNNGTPLGVTYRAFLDNPGPNYTVTMNSSVTLDALTISSASAFLKQTAGVLVTPDFYLTAGKYELDGGELSNTTLHIGAGVFSITGNSSNLLRAVTIDGNATLAASYTNVRDGLTVNGVLTMSHPSFNTTLRLIGDQTLSGIFVMDPATTGNERVFELSTGSEVTLAPGSILRGGGGRVGDTGAVTGDVFINQGTISADRLNKTLTVYSTLQNQGTIEVISGGRLTVQDLQGNAGSARADGASSILTLAGTYTNTGLIPVSNGATLTLNGDWNNSGAITLTGASTLNLGGTFTPGDLGTINRGTGAVNLTGLMQNSGTFNLNAATGTWTMRGGTIEGGTVHTEGGAVLAAAGTTTSTLRNVQLDGTMTATSTTVRFDGNWGVTGLVTATNSTIEVGGSFTAASLGSFSRTGTVLKIIGTLNNAGNTLSSTSAQGQIQLAGGTINGGTVLADPNFALGAGTNTMNGVTLQGALSLGNRSLNTTDLTIASGSAVNLSTFSQTLTLGGDWTNNGTINMAGGTLSILSPFRFSDLGTFNNTDGQVEVHTTFDNTASALNLSDNTAFWEFRGGSVLGGTLNMAGGNNLAVSGGQTTVFDGVAVNGQFAIINPGSTVLVKNGLNLNGTARLLYGGALEFEGSQTLSAGTIDIEQTNEGGYVRIQPGHTLTLGSGVNVEGGGSAGAVGAPSAPGAPVTLVNQGTIRANNAGQTLTVAPDIFQNQGTLAAVDGGRLVVSHLTGNAGALSVSGNFTQMTLDGAYNITQPVSVGAGSTLNLNGNWNSSATITSSGTVNLNGSLTSTSFGAINGGTINLLGSVNNTGSTLPLTTTWTLAGGSITGGTVTGTPTALLRNAVGSNAQLNGVTVTAGLDLLGGDLAVDSASTLQGGALFEGGGGRLHLLGNHSLDNQTFVFQNAPNPGVLRIDNGALPGTLTLGSGMIVRGGDGFLGAAPGLFADTDTIINNGRISADTAGGTLVIQSNTFTNNGVVEAINGGTVQIGVAGGSTAWTNAGIIRLNNGSLNLAGQFTVGSLGNFLQTNSSVNIIGTLDNTGSVLSINPATGPWNLKGGTILGGTVNLTGGLRLGITGGETLSTLDGVTVNGRLDFNGGSLALRNGSTFIGANMVGGSIRFEAPSSTITGGAWDLAPRESSPGSGSWSTAAIYPYNPAGTGLLTIGSGVTLRGTGAMIGDLQAQNPRVDSITNNGTISADNPLPPNFEIWVAPDQFTNNGRMEAVGGGRMRIGAAYFQQNYTPTAWTNTGVIESLSGLIEVGGVTNTAGLGILRRSGTGQLYLNGVIDNTGSVLAFGPDLNPSGIGAYIHRGTITTAPGFTTPIGGKLDGVTVSGNAAFVNGQFENGLTLAGVGTFTGTFSSLGTQSLMGGLFHLQNGTIEVANSHALTVDALATVDGYGTILGNVGSLVNRGLISANAATQVFSISSPDFTNWGTLEATAGGKLSVTGIGIPMNWVNRGVIQAGAGSTVTLGGTFSSLGGTLLNSGGNMIVSGTLNNQGSVLTIGGATGDIELRGTIAGGTINAPAGSRLLVKSGRLDGVVMNGRVDVNGLMNIKNNLVMNGVVSTLNQTGATILFESAANTVTGGEFVLNGASMQAPDIMQVALGGTVTTSATTLIRGGNAELFKRTPPQDNHFINNGTIRADQSGKVLRIASDDFQNHGAVEAVGGGILELSVNSAGNGTANTWASDGILRVDNSTLRLAGRFDAASAAGIQRIGTSTVELLGRMSAAGGLTLSGAQNSWTLAGGAMAPNFIVSGAHILGGTVNLQNGAVFNVGAAQGAVFENTTINGNINVTGAGWRLGARNSMTLNGDMNVAGAGNFDFNSGSNINGNAHFLFNIPAGPLASFNLIDTTFGSGVVIEGGGLTISRNGSGSGYHFTNNGRITANWAPSPLIVDPVGFVVNNGTMEAVDGGTLRLGSKWTNNGTLRIDDGNLILAGQLPQNLGTIERTGGTLTLAGFVSNENSTFHMTQALGDWIFNGAAVKGGTLEMHPSVSTYFRGNESILENTSVIGDMVIDGPGAVLNAKHSLSLAGTLTLTAPDSTIMFTGPNALFSSGTIHFDPTLPGNERILKGNLNATLTLGSQAVVHGGRGRILTSSSSTIINQGRISSDVSGQTIFIHTERFQNDGVVEAINGGLLEFVPPPITAPPPMDFRNSGRLSPGLNSLYISGDFEQTATGILDMRIEGFAPGSGYSQLVIGGLATLAGELRVSMSAAPFEGAAFQLLQQWGGEFEGRFDVLDFPALPGDLRWNFAALYETGFVSIIPAPGTLALGALGVIMLARRERRRGGSR